MPLTKDVAEIRLAALVSGVGDLRREHLAAAGGTAGGADPQEYLGRINELRQDAQNLLDELPANAPPQGAAVEPRGRGLFRRAGTEWTADNLSQVRNDINGLVMVLDQIAPRLGDAPGLR